MVKWSSRINNKTVYTLLMLVCIMGFWFFENFYTPATYTPADGEGTTTGIPDYFIPGSTTGALVKHNHFWLSLNYSHSFNLLASSFKNINSKAVNPKSPEPP